MIKQYYSDMLKLGQLIPLEFNGKVKGCVTYVLCNSIEDISTKNPFEPMFTSEGSHCYIEQFISQMKLSVQESMSSFKCLVDILQKKHPEIRIVFWKRYNRKTKKLRLHIYNLQREKSYVYN